MTRAPRSASCLVANGADMACSTETTVTPVNGAIGHLSLARSREVGFLSFADGRSRTDSLRPKPWFLTHTVRRKGNTAVAALFMPVVRTVTMPTLGRDLDSRNAITSDLE